MVTADRDPKSSNPDVIPLGSITNCGVDINEGRIEVTREDANGNCEYCGGPIK